MRKKPINELAQRGKIEEFRISLYNRYSDPIEEADLSVQAVNGNLMSIITKCAIAASGKIVRRDTGKPSKETKDLIKRGKARNSLTPQVK